MRQKNIFWLLPMSPIYRYSYHAYCLQGCGVGIRSWHADFTAMIAYRILMANMQKHLYYELGRTSPYFQVPSPEKLVMRPSELHNKRSLPAKQEDPK